MRICTMGVVFVIFALVVVCRASIWEGIINMEAPASTTGPTMEEITTARASTTVPTMEEITTARTMAPTTVASSSARASNVSLEGWCSAPDAAYNPAILMPKGPQGPDGAILEYDLLSNSQLGIHYPGGHHLGSFVPATTYNPRNGEKQIYVPSAADQDPGTNQVTITASKYQDPWSFTQISSARLDTKGIWTTSQSPKTKNRGFLEVRSLMPANMNGGNYTGALAAIWMQASSRQEGHKTQIDIAKLKNGDPTVLLTHNPHNPIHLRTDMTKIPVIFGLEWNVQAGLGQIDLTWYVTAFDFPSKQWKTQNTTKSVLESEGDANDYFDLYNTFNGDGFYLLIGLAQGGDFTEVHHEADLLVDGPQHVVIESAKVYRIPEAVLKLTSFTQSTVDPVYMNNIDYLLKGYDILKGNPLPTDASVDPGYRELIFEAEYDGSTTADKRYHQPKGTSFVDCTGTCTFTFSSTQISGTKSYQKSLETRVDAEVGGEFEGWGAKFSASSGFKEVAERSSSHSSLFTSSYATCCSYAAQVLSYTPPPLHENFRAGVQTLTENYEEKVYQKFIERFGTHYIQWAQFGSLYGQQSEISKDAWATMKSNKVDISFGASVSAYGATVSASLLTEDEDKMAKEFSSKTTNQKLFTIGAAPPKDGDLVEWSRAVVDNPAPMKIRLVSILELLGGQYGMDISDYIKANLNKALNDHCSNLAKSNEVTTCSAPGPDPPFPEGPAVLYKYISNYEQIWNDHGSQGNHDVSIWKAAEYENDFCSLGDVAVDYYNQPWKTAVLVKHSTPGVMHPTGFHKVWDDRGSGANMDCAIYKMTAHAGFTCLGGVAVGSYDLLPDHNKYCCVKDDYILPGVLEFLYNDHGTHGDNDLSLWKVTAGNNPGELEGGNFVPIGGYDKPDHGYLLNGDHENVQEV